MDAPLSEKHIAMAWMAHNRALRDGYLDLVGEAEGVFASAVELAKEHSELSACRFLRLLTDHLKSVAAGSTGLQGISRSS